VVVLAPDAAGTGAGGAIFRVEGGWPDRITAPEWAYAPSLIAALQRIAVASGSRGVPQLSWHRCLTLARRGSHPTRRSRLRLLN